MYNEKANRKACFKEAKKEYAMALKKTEHKRSEQEVQIAKDEIFSQISVMQSKRDGLILKAVEVDKNNPTAAKTIVAYVKILDKQIEDLTIKLAKVECKQAGHEVYALRKKANEILRELETQPVDYMSKKYLKALKEEKAMHDIMQRRAEAALEEEMKLYTSDILPSVGEGSAAEHDFEVAKQKALIEEIDED